MTSRQRPDVAAKVAGRFEYASDVTVDGALHGATVRSTVAHGRIRSIDTALAVRVPGVLRVLTALDVPGTPMIGHIVADRPVFAHDIVRHHGEPIAFVVATTASAAAEGARRVRVIIDPLPVQADPERALDPDVAPLHASGNTYRSVRLRRGHGPFAAPVTVEGTWWTGRQDQLFLAPESGVAEPDGAGGVVLRVATQDLHADRRQIAAALGLPEDRVRVRLAGIGGAFGGREDITLQVHLCLAALLMDRPVTTTYRRSESFLAHPKRHPARMRYELGAEPDGHLVHLRADLLLDGGAYASTSGPVLGSACYFAAGPYRIPNVDVTGRVVATNNPVSGAMRGFGAVQSCFAMESTMDLLATKLGMDPVELRRLNALRTGDEFPTSGQRVDDDSPVLEVIDRCAALPMPPAPAERYRVRGIGFAVGVKNHLYGEGVSEWAEATVRIDVEGVTVVSAATECGQGIEGVLCRLVADELGGLPVVMRPADSDAGYAGSSSASRASWMSGGAVIEAARAARDELLAAVSERMSGCVTLGDGSVRVDGRPVSLRDVLVERAITAHRTYHAPPTRAGDPTDGQGDVHVSWMFVAHRAVVDVDPDLGTVAVAQIATAQDVGRALDRREVFGQIRGGISQGLGLALDEHLGATEGIVVNAGLTDYLVPTMVDMPEVLVDLVERGDERSPHGGKGAGEPPSLSSTAAIASAVRAATGRPVVRVPIRPEDLTG